MKDIVAFYPYTFKETSYISTMQDIISQKYEVIDYIDFRNGFIDSKYVKCIYLNWLEYDLLDRDEKFLKKVKSANVKIIWVFHNRIPHDSQGDVKKIDNIRFLANISDYVVLHSKASIYYLEEYCMTVKEKMVYIPHPNFILDYGRYGKINIIVKENQLVFGILGMIRPYKNIEILIKAFKNIPEYEHCALLIAGKANSKSYIEEIKKSISSNDNIYLIDEYISSLEMGTFLEFIDVLVLPYNYVSGMNSGAMIMAFSYGKTVVVSDIAMAREYSDQYIYRYSYTNEYNHIEVLSKQLSKVFKDGKLDISKKGKYLKELVKKNNSKEIVKKILLDLIEE